MHRIDSLYPVSSASGASRRGIFTVWALLALALPAFAGSPRVNHLYPSGGQRGAEIEVTCSGSNLEDAKDLLFDTPGFEIAPGAAEKNKFKVKIKVGSEVQLGEHTFRVITGTGVSDLRLFYVSPFPMVEEAPEKPDDSPDKDQPQHIEMGTTVYGHTPREDKDVYEVDAKKGQRITVEVVGARLQTQNIYDPLVTIAKEGGALLANVDDCAFSRQDPVASIIAPDDGKYLVTIKDSTNSGPGECHYLMSIGSFARPLSIFPLGGKAGEELKVQLLGDPSGPIEKTIKLPDHPADRFEVFTDQDAPAPTPNIIRVSAFDSVNEVEPNNDLEHATAAPPTLPMAFNGIIGEKSDIDYFKFTAKKGQAYDLNVYARQLRSPLDSVLAIYDAKGKRLAENDDDGQPDSHLRWSAPADGEFCFSVRDQLNRGGPLYTYRVEIKPAAPQLLVWLPEVVINSSQERRAIVVPKGNRYASLVRVKREDVGGAAEIDTKDLPPGVTVAGGLMSKDVDTIPMVFEAASETPTAAQTFSMDVKLTEPAKDAPPVPSRVQHDVDVAENGNQKSFYSIREDRLPVAVVDQVPVKLTLVQPKVPILRSGSMELKVVAERQGDFKGAVTLSLLYSPPGIGSPGTVTLKEGENEGKVTISANDNANLATWKVCVVGSADFGKGPVWVSTQLGDLQVAAPFLAGKIDRTFVDQGSETAVTVKLDQKEAFDGKAKITLQGLPAGCTADPQEITKDDKEVKFNVKASKDAQVGQHRNLFCEFRLEKDGEPMTATFARGGVLRVDKGGAVAKNDGAK
ncbi:MAG TPA: hypothetical protein VGH90_01435 [Chthoniobacteraceae bacterium]